MLVADVQAIANQHLGYVVEAEDRNSEFSRRRKSLTKISANERARSWKRSMRRRRNAPAVVASSCRR